jgi:hypothetical protein
MTIRTLALASGVTTAQDHRLTLGVFQVPAAAVLERRAGLAYYPGAGDLVGTAALQATVAPFVAVVDGTSNALQGSYVVVADAAETITFDGGEPSVVRSDQVILQVRDNTYDASGSTDARVVYLKGDTTTGEAAAVPPSSLALWQVDVPIGASTITFDTARTDKRTWTGTPLRVPVSSQTERDALPDIPGLEVLRLDTGDIEQWWGDQWRSLTTPPVSSVHAFKAGDTSRANSNTLSADPDLSVTVEPLTNYMLDCLLIFEAGATPDMKVNFGVPSGAAGNAAYFPSPATSTNLFTDGVDDLTDTVVLTGAGTNSPLGVRISGGLRVGATGGAFALNWAQNTVDATAAILHAGSWMRLEKV